MSYKFQRCHLDYCNLLPNSSLDPGAVAQSHGANSHSPFCVRRGGEKGPAMSYSAIRHSNFEGVGITLLHPRARDFPAARVVGGHPANGRLTPSRIGGARGSGAASDGRRQSSPPSFTDKPSRLRPSAGCPPSVPYVALGSGTARKAADLSLLWRQPSG